MPAESVNTGRLTATAGGLLSAVARRHASALALADERRAVTYAELLDEAARMANGLREAGVRAGQRVAIHGDDTVETVAAYLACWLADCTAVHVSAKLAPPEVSYQLADAEVSAYCFSGRLGPVAAQLGGLEELACVRSLDGDGDGWPRLGSATNRVPVPAASAEDAAIVGYTSGTTGRPKGAVISHRTLALSIRLAPHHYRIPAGSRLAYSGSISFVGSFWGQVLPHLYVGGMVRLLGGYDLESWFAAMRADRSTFTFLSTPMIPDFVEAIGRADDVRGQLVTVMHAGSKAARPLVEAAVEALGEAYLETWGLTEVVGSLTATSAADMRGEGEADDVLASAGRALPSARVWAAGEDGAVLPPGEEGELVAEVDTVFDRYWNDPEKTAETVRDGVFHSGDAGYLDGAGYAYITGRRADLIVSGGANVYPAEVERVLLDIPGVRQAAVVGVPDRRWGETVAAAVVFERGASLSVEQVQRACRGELAGYKKPTVLMELGQLPETGNQKVDRRRIRQLIVEAR